MIRLITSLILFWALPIHAQTKKQVEALKIATPIQIDGVLNETCYQQAKPATDFVQLQPYNGKPSYQSSEVYFFYDPHAVYVGAMLYDSSPDSIFNLLGERDNIGMSDYFGVYLDPYNEGQLAYGFFITPSGVQTDIKAVKRDGDYEDENWNTIWESKAMISPNGWVVEMRIPYSAIRFPQKEVHTWGVNMFRNIRRYSSNTSWSLIDIQKTGFIHQQGELTGIKQIDPPVRLSFSPYLSTYLEYQEGSSSSEFLYKGGMDVKYGLSESFTLDMMLIPDFGQVQSDDKQLNLSAYELYYDEKRQFFTEGVELFERADIFYSRRVGSSPKFKEVASNDCRENEVVSDLPTETRLINATKISGRSKSGWGIGSLNAMTMNSFATIKDTLTNKNRKILVQPFTNFNVSVIDKTLKNNSYISLINTNMSMYDNPFEANVTATEFQIRDKSMTYAIIGKGGFSHRFGNETEDGFFATLKLAKNTGKLRGGIAHHIFSDQYNPNDLGYIRRNNETYTYHYIGYHIIEPFSVFNQMHLNIWLDNYRMFHPNEKAGHEIGLDYYVWLKSNYEFDLTVKSYSAWFDYYEPRVDGRFVKYNPHFEVTLYMNSDYRKKIAGYINIGGMNRENSNHSSLWIHGGLDFRVGHHILIGYDASWSDEQNNIGHVDHGDHANDPIYLGRRRISNIENELEVACALNNQMSFRFRARHYWSVASYRNYYSLLPNGSLLSEPDYLNDHNENYNVFNIDTSFRWVFAPGSELSLAWKNAMEMSEGNTRFNYWKNFKHTVHLPQTNSISLKILYYIDVNQFKKS